MFLSKSRKSQNLVPRNFILGRFGRKKMPKEKSVKKWDIHF